MPSYVEITNVYKKIHYSEKPDKFIKRIKKSRLFHPFYRMTNVIILPAST